MSFYCVLFFTRKVSPPSWQYQPSPVTAVWVQKSRTWKDIVPGFNSLNWDYHGEGWVGSRGHCRRNNISLWCTQFMDEQRHFHAPSHSPLTNMRSCYSYRNPAIFQFSHVLWNTGMLTNIWLQQTVCFTNSHKRYSEHTHPPCFCLYHFLCWGNVASSQLELGCDPGIKMTPCMS